VFLVYLVAILALPVAGVIVGVSAPCSRGFGELLLREAAAYLEVPVPITSSPLSRSALRGGGERDRESFLPRVPRGRSRSRGSPNSRGSGCERRLFARRPPSAARIPASRLRGLERGAGCRTRGTVVSDLVSGEAIDVFETGSFFEIDDEHRLYVIGANPERSGQSTGQRLRASSAAGLRSQIISRDATQLQKSRSRVTTMALSERLRRSSRHLRRCGNISMLTGSRAPPARREERLLAGIGLSSGQLTRLVVNLIGPGARSGEVSVHPESVMLARR